MSSLIFYRPDALPDAQSINSVTVTNIIINNNTSTITTYNKIKYDIKSLTYTEKLTDSQLNLYTEL